MFFQVLIFEYLLQSKCCHFNKWPFCGNLHSALKITSFVKVLLILKTLACCTWFRGQADSNCVMGYFKREPRIVLFNLEFVRSRVMHEALQPSIWGSTRPVLTRNMASPEDGSEGSLTREASAGKPGQGSLDREAWGSSNFAFFSFFLL